jgi:hypothetical protein
MPHPAFIGQAFRLVRTLEFTLDQGPRKLPVRAEFLQDPAEPTHFRYRVWCLEWFELQPQYHDEPLPHEAWTTLSLPNLGEGAYFEAPDLDAAEKRFYADFQKEFSKRRAEA